MYFLIKTKKNELKIILFVYFSLKKNSFLAADKKFTQRINFLRKDFLRKKLILCFFNFIKIGKNIQKIKKYPKKYVEKSSRINCVRNLSIA